MRTDRVRFKSNKAENFFHGLKQGVSRLVTQARRGVSGKNY